MFMRGWAGWGVMGEAEEEGTSLVMILGLGLVFLQHGRQCSGDGSCAAMAAASFEQIALIIPRS